ncbi:hypothetical protein PI124_g899 [Phytophthora idaei]|nr:hypothetical protein PI125_g5372 [Phytophthora idaei]KAG3173982.1 hypothetical protein PI126_g581 [Phytophthora idaei]KAG3254522.1 hypothetical protein PI124_g899 [Phytophthora idaei]
MHEHEDHKRPELPPLVARKRRTEGMTKCVAQVRQWCVKLDSLCSRHRSHRWLLRWFRSLQLCPNRQRVCGDEDLEVLRVLSQDKNLKVKDSDN